MDSSKNFQAIKNDPFVSIALDYERTKTSPKKLTGNIVLTIKNLNNNNSYTIDLTDKSYKKDDRKSTISINEPVAAIVWDNSDSFNWYDVSIKVQGYNNFEKRYAGRVETGQKGKTDPLMAGMM